MRARQVVAFTVLGVPVPQGSKSAFVVKGRAVIAESNRAKLKPYRASVAEAAAAAMNGAGLVTSPVRMELYLHFPRPKSHYGRGSQAAVLRVDAPAYVATRPDAGKVARAIEDALTGIVWRDDSQVADLRVVKLYGDPPRAVVRIEQLDDLASEDRRGASA